MPTNRGIRIFAVRYLCLALVLVLVVSAARQGIGAYYFQQNLSDGLQKAMAWDPANPVYPAALASLVHLYGRSANPYDVVRLCQTAVRLSPSDAGYMADLAQANDWAGRTNVALRLFQRAQELFPNSPEINWKIANFYVRCGKSDDALSVLKNILLSGVVPKNQIFALCDTARINYSTIIDKLLSPDMPSLFAYLNFETGRGNFSGAQETWNRLISLDSSFEPKEIFPFFDALINSKELGRASQVWLALASRFHDRIPSPSSAVNLINNGNFRADILNGGFDWRIYPVSGTVVTQSAAGPTSDARSLRIDFEGTENLYYGSVLQFVPVQPRTKYDFSAVSRSEAITTDTGVGLQITDGYDDAKILGLTQPRTGTMQWSEQQVSFETAPEMRLLVVRVVRLPSKKFDNKIAGTFWLSRVLLTPRP